MRKTTKDRPAPQGFGAPKPPRKAKPKKKQENNQQVREARLWAFAVLQDAADDCIESDWNVMVICSKSKFDTHYEVLDQLLKQKRLPSVLVDIFPGKRIGAGDTTVISFTPKDSPHLRFGSPSFDYDRSKEITSI